MKAFFLRCRPSACLSVGSLIRPLAVTLTAMALSACALLSTPDPVQTYRFGGVAASSSAAPVVASPVQVILRRVELPEAVEGDKLLGVTGTETAYIAGARWVSPAAAFATHTFAAHVEAPSAWDSTVSLVMLVETLLAAVQDLGWPVTEGRMERLEALYARTRFFRRHR